MVIRCITSPTGVQAYIYVKYNALNIFYVTDTIVYKTKNNFTRHADNEDTIAAAACIRKRGLRVFTCVGYVVVTPHPYYVPLSRRRRANAVATCRVSFLGPGV